MANLNKVDLELLSAYLDDALDGPERLRAEQLLATNPGASRYFGGLRAARECLKSVPSSRLGSSLSARVLEQARAQALADGLPEDHHVLRSSTAPTAGLERSIDTALKHGSQQASPQAAQGGAVGHGDSLGGSGDRVPSAGDSWATKTITRGYSNRILWSALAVVAAGVGGVAVLPFILSNHPQNVVAELTAPVAPSAVMPADSIAEVSPFESVAKSDSYDAADADRNEPFREGELPERPDAVAHVMQGDGASERLKQDLVPQAPVFDFLMIIDAVVADEAWQNGRFEKLLGELEIPIASPIVADNELLKALEETRVAAGHDDQNTAANQPRAALVFLRADGATLDRLHQAMHADRTDFPQVVTDLSIDQHSAALHKLLRSQASSQSQGGPSARVLSMSADISSSDDVVPSFVPAERHKMVSSQSRPAPALPSSSAYLGNPAGMSEVLVILRESNRK